MAKKETIKKEKTKGKKQTKNINEALFAFQGENLAIPRNGKGNISGREYKYATLDDLINIIRPALQKYGMMFTQVAEGADLVTTLIHVGSDTKITGKLPLGNPSSSQDLGSRITYLRRYALISLLGLVTEDDVDGVQAKGEATPIRPPKITENRGAATVSAEINGRKVADAHSAETVLDNTGPHEEIPLESEALKKAKAAIASCASAEALEVIKGQIQKSQKLSMPEIVSLIEVVKARGVELAK